MKVAAIKKRDVARELRPFFYGSLAFGIAVSLFILLTI